MDKTSLEIISLPRYVRHVERNGQEGTNMVIAIAMVCLGLLTGVAVSDANMA